MRFDKKAEIQALTRTSDGMGGYSESWNTIQTVDCALTSVSAKLMLRLYGFINAEARSMMTRSPLPDGDVRVVIDGKTFKVRQRGEYRRVCVYLLEVAV